MKRLNTANDASETPRKSTFLDAMVGVSIFLVIIAFAYMIMNPGKRAADVRNSQRNSDALAIMQSVLGYVNTTGNIPATIPINRECASIGNEICKTGATDCKNYIDLTAILSDNGLKSIPVDSSRTDGNGAGYYITHDGEGSIIICAPLAERNVTISIKQFMY